MNEFERRSIEVLQNYQDLLAVARSINKAAIVEDFSYTVGIGTIAAPLVAGATQQGLIAVQSDAHFVIEYITCAVVRFIVGPTGYSLMSPAGNMLLQITDTGAGELLYSSATLGSILAGTVAPAVSGIPLHLPIPRIIPPNTNIKVEATQLNTPVGLPTSTCYVTLHGARVLQL